VRSIIAARFSALALAAVGCGKKPPAVEQTPAPSEQPPTPQQPSAAASGIITDRDWVLIGLGERTSPVGAGNQPVILRLEAATTTAAGFGGCNRYRATYTLSGDSLRFGPVISTKMSCADGDELERGYLGALEKIATYEASDSSLTLKAADAPLARFRPR
jgi:heat shock protein HslJ